MKKNLPKTKEKFKNNKSMLYLSMLIKVFNEERHLDFKFSL